MKRTLALAVSVLFSIACNASAPRASSGPSDAGADVARTPPPEPTVDDDGNPIDWHANDFKPRPTRPRDEYCLEHVKENFKLPPGLYDDPQAPTSVFLKAIAKACKKNQPELAAAALRAANASQPDRARILFRAGIVHEAWDPICRVTEADATKHMTEINRRLWDMAKAPVRYPVKHCRLEGPNWCAFDVGTWVFIRVLWVAEGYRAAPGDMPNFPDIMQQFAIHEEWSDGDHRRCDDVSW